MSAHNMITKDKLAFSLTAMVTGCGDPLVGDWDLVDIPPDAGSYLYAFSGYDEECGDYSYSRAREVFGLLAVDSDLGVRFELSLTYRYEYTTEHCDSDSSLETDEFSYMGTAALDGDTYEILLHEDDGGELELSCKVDRSELRCKKIETSYSYIFEQL